MTLPAGQAGGGAANHGGPPPAPALSARARPGAARKALTAPAIALFFMSPAIGELLSGSAPPAEFFSPIVFALIVPLYGLGALLCRELTFRWGKGWPTLLVLGAAYGIIEEGLVVASFFNVNHADLGALRGYDRWLGVNWLWSLDLTVYHAAISVGAAVLVVSHVFPRRRGEPWVGRRTLGAFYVLFPLHCLALFGLFVLHSRFAPPVPHFLATALLAAGLLVAARRLPRRPLSAPRAQAWTAHPFWFGLIGFLATVGLFINLFATPAMGIPVPLAMLVAPALVAATFLLVAVLSSGGAGLGERHELALGTGALTVLALFAFIAEMDETRTDNPAGMAVVGLAALIGLAWLTVRTKRRARRESEPHPEPPPADRTE